VNLAITLALVPALFAPGRSSSDEPVGVAAGSTFETVPVVARAAGGSAEVVALGPSEVAAAATTTTAPPPPTTVAPTSTTVRAAAKPKAAPAPTTTTTAEPRPTTTTTPAEPRPTTTAPPEDGTETGKASWYDHRPGICAHKSLPFGTEVTVTHTENGRSTTCTVGDRGPYVEGWIIDLHPEQFEQLAPRSVGVIPVRISW